MNPEFNNSPKKKSGITIGAGVKLGIGISIGVLIVLFALSLITVFLFRHLSSPSITTTQKNEPAISITQPSSNEDSASNPASLSQEEKLRKRLDGVEAANKSANKYNCVVTLTGPDQDIITVTAKIKHYAKDAARVFATSFIDSFLASEQTVNNMIALEVKSVVVTDGKRIWTRDLKTGTLTEQEIK